MRTWGKGAPAACGRLETTMEHRYEIDAQYRPGATCVFRGFGGDLADRCEAESVLASLESQGYSWVRFRVVDALVRERFAPVVIREIGKAV